MTPQQPAWRLSPADAGPSIGIIGAGFSGTLLALHLLRRSPRGVRIQLIERNKQFGRGLAYSTGNPNHLLNVPAGRMSAFADRPGDFVDWLSTRPEHWGRDAPPTERCFVPRASFGAYVRHLLNGELRDPAARRRLALVRGDVVGLDATAPGIRLQLDAGRSLDVDIAVLATGNLPAEAPAVADESFYATPHYRPDPWAAETLAELDQTAPVLLIGTGLTMVDSVISLLDRGHFGPIHAVSRRGLLPHRHGPPAAVAAPLLGRALPTTLAALSRLVRAEITSAEDDEDGDWRSVIDGLRPATQDLWRSMATADRARFLRHLRPWWDIHRHRMPPAVADRIDGARRIGQLRIMAGRILGYEVRAEGHVVAVVRPRGGAESRSVDVQRVINCSGPSCDYERITHPLIRSLLDDGLARPDPLRLGIDVTPLCALRSCRGEISQRLYAIGPVTRAAFWEVTSVPDIRRQCEVLAAHLAALAVALPARRPSAQLEAATHGPHKSGLPIPSLQGLRT
jgi:uncharacterized NAD(P)/FAD-binding protein YdhS